MVEVPNCDSSIAEASVTLPNHDAETLVILAYNVPVEYQLTNFENLLSAHISDISKVTIIPPFSWQDRVDSAWKIVCQDRNIHESILKLESVLVKLNGIHSTPQSIAFVAGDEYDLPSIPFREDEKSIMLERPRLRTSKR
ncbi:uncharacterized protein BXIN_0318 [Babesia sp. Xinjiang]|uniref:uncharacterized protein n=1 Tax=Babesia sp. Xinjiang TaxID=462227 RepID=UPI000A215824|nr:uncharacterized protein BXIN_0289 [Babesia sp. Xinjiang]XP_028871612.1 uncharacterized protein BXIN_0318 [Babesia sp. Xinjiang]ORM41085.1 hypothetical protein BXIN_0289 [Babesia sp. Xinjiang]ORM41156.1 hypothetical protein BXIN_0318 [Babesia sp. Xinjiang]